MIGTMTRLGSFAAATIFAVTILGGSAFAHHSFTAEFDVVGSDGKVVNWALETGGANALYRRGWRKEDLPAGTVLAVEGWQARNGTPTANVSVITLANGKRLFAGSSNTEAPQQ